MQLILTEGPELERPRQRALARRGLEAGHQQPGELAAPESQRDQHGGPRRSAQQGQQQLNSGRVSPVDIVEGQQQRPAGSERLEQDTDGPVQPVALAFQELRTGEAGQRWEHPAQVRQPLAAESLQPGRMQRLQVVVEGILERAEGNDALELHCPALEHERPIRLGSSAQLRQQAGLADPRLPRQRDEARRVVSEAAEDGLEGPPLLDTPGDAASGTCSHFRGFEPKPGSAW
jgi:hypothetical protein